MEFYYIEKSLNTAFGTNVFKIIEENIMKDGYIIYTVYIKTVYNNDILYRLQTSVKQDHPQFERLINDIKVHFISDIFKILLYGLISDNVENQFEKRVVSIKEYIVQEALLNYYRSYFNNNIIPFKYQCIESHKHKIILHIEYNKVIVDKEGTKKEFIAKDVNEINKVINEINNFINEDSMCIS